LIDCEVHLRFIGREGDRERREKNVWVVGDEEKQKSTYVRLSQECTN
jgi:hypothetical protein